jgi:hypothetical protein
VGGGIASRSLYDVESWWGGPLACMARSLVNHVSTHSARCLEFNRIDRTRSGP